MSHVSDTDHCKLDAIVRSDCIIESHEISDAARGWRRVQVTKVWRTERLLGQGGFGEVHLQVLESDKTTKRALKIIPTRGLSMSEPECQRELIAMMEFRKPKYREAAVFVDFFGWFRNDDAMFLAMEYMVLGDLEQNLLEIEDSPEHMGPALPEEETHEVARQILEGLKIMHAEGFAHRDLKPRNVFVVQKQPQWWVKLGDFGLSKQRTDQTAFRTHAGTQQYMAPELYYYVQGADTETSEFTSAVDLWALGCIIYRMVVGAVPFPSLLSLRNFCRDSASVPLNIPPSMQEAAAFVNTLLQPNPKDRPTASVALLSTWLSQRKRPLISLQPMLDTHSTGLSASHGNYNTVSHKGLQSQYSAPSTIHPPLQSHRGPASEPSQLISRKAVGQPASPASSDFSYSKSQSPSRAPSDDLQAVTDKFVALSPGSSSKESRRSVSAASEVKSSQDDTTVDAQDYGAGEAKMLKAQGNEAMVDHNYGTAVSLYTQALKASPQSEAQHYLSLRAGAHHALGNYTAACQDAEAAIAAEPRFVMAWNRLGRAKLAMGSLADVEASVEAYENAIRYDGNGRSENSKQGFEAAQKKLNELRDAETQKWLRDQELRDLELKGQKLEDQMRRERMLRDQKPKEADTYSLPLAPSKSSPEKTKTEMDILNSAYESVRQNTAGSQAPKPKKPSLFSRVFKRDEPHWPPLSSPFVLKLHVMTLTGKTITVLTRSNEKILDIKRSIESQEGFPPDQQRLILAGRQLEDHRTVSDYRIPHQSTLHLLLRPQGSP